MKAKVLGVLLIGLVTCSSAITKDDALAFAKACIIETKVSEEEAFDFWEPLVNYDNTTPNMKCQLKCVMEKMTHFNGGVLDIEKIAKDWNELDDGLEAIDPKAFGACEQEKGGDDCETAFKFIKCVRQFQV